MRDKFAIMLVLALVILSGCAVQSPPSNVWDLTPDQTSICRLHNNEMRSGLVGINWSRNPPDSHYDDIKMSLFPHSSESVYASSGSPAKGREVAKVFICPKCKLAHSEWLAKSAKNYSEKKQ